MKRLFLGAKEPKLPYHWNVKCASFLMSKVLVDPVSFFLLGRFFYYGWVGGLFGWLLACLLACLVGFLPPRHHQPRLARGSLLALIARQLEVAGGWFKLGGVRLA